MKIKVEDLTIDELKENSIIIFANSLVQVAGRTSLELGYTLKYASLSLLTASEILLTIIQKTDGMSNDEAQELKHMALKYAQNYQKTLEKSGIMNLMETIKGIKKKNKV